MDLVSAFLELDKCFLSNLLMGDPEVFSKKYGTEAGLQGIR